MKIEKGFFWFGLKDESIVGVIVSQRGCISIISLGFEMDLRFRVLVEIDLGLKVLMCMVD